MVALKKKLAATKTAAIEVRVVSSTTYQTVEYHERFAFTSTAEKDFMIRMEGERLFMDQFDERCRNDPNLDAKVGARGYRIQTRLVAREKTHATVLS